MSKQSPTKCVRTPRTSSTSSKNRDCATYQPAVQNQLLGLRVTGFLIVYFGLQWIWQSVQGGDIERFVIHNATVAPAAFLVNLLTPMIQARAVEFTLQAPGGGINILNGCEGLDALFLLVSAFAVASLTWRARVIGLLSGVVVVFVVNQARILVLFYAYRASPELFNPLHAMVAPIAVVLLVCAYFYGCLFLAGRNAKSA